MSASSLADGTVQLTSRFEVKEVQLEPTHHYQGRHGWPTEVSTEGFAGSSCQKASQFIERALGSRQSEQLTADYYKTASATEANQLKQGEGQ